MVYKCRTPYTVIVMYSSVCSSRSIKRAVILSVWAKEEEMCHHKAFYVEIPHDAQTHNPTSR